MLKHYQSLASPNLQGLEEKETKRGGTLVPQSNISYNTIKKNKTLFDCVGKDCFEADQEDEGEQSE
jgi:hypothetical protein